MILLAVLKALAASCVPLIVGALVVYFVVASILAAGALGRYGRMA